MSNLRRRSAKDFSGFKKNLYFSETLKVIASFRRRLQLRQRRVPDCEKIIDLSADDKLGNRVGVTDRERSREDRKHVFSQLSETAAAVARVIIFHPTSSSSSSPSSTSTSLSTSSLQATLQASVFYFFLSTYGQSRQQETKDIAQIARHH